MQILNKDELEQVNGGITGWEILGAAAAVVSLFDYGCRFGAGLAEGVRRRLN